LDEKAILVKEF
jgi:hypothetical protein